MASKPQYIRVLRNNIKQALRRRRFDEAATLLARLKDEDPMAVDTRGLELEWLVESGRTEEALLLARQLLELYPDSARIQFLAGRSFYRRKDYATAVDCFEESRRLMPRWESQRWLGKTLTQIGRFDDAEALLHELAPRHPVVQLDLAWLYERRDLFERAVVCIDAYLKRHPGAGFAKAKRKQLLAHSQDPGTLAADVDMLTELDEEIPVELLSPYLCGLLDIGESPKARRFVLERLDRFDTETAVSLAWDCRRRQAFDLAMALFLKALPARPNEIKLLASLELCARKCDRVEELAERYEALGKDQPNLYGRRRQLLRGLGQESDDSDGT